MTGLRLLVALPLLIAASAATAELIDDIELTDIRDEGVARLRLLVPVALDRHHPANEGELLFIQLRILNRSGAVSLRREQQKRSRAAPLVPGFRVRSGHFPGCDALAVCMIVQFDEPARYRVEISADHRTLMLIFPKPNNK